MEGVEIQARYIFPDAPNKRAVFEFSGGQGVQEIAERDIHQLIGQMRSDPKGGEQKAEVFSFLVVEAKKRAEKLKAQGEIDKEKLWVSATDKPLKPGQAVVGKEGQS